MLRNVSFCWILFLLIYSGNKTKFNVILTQNKIIISKVSLRTIFFRLALFIGTVATDSAVSVATLPVSKKFLSSLLFYFHFLAALGPGPCSVCS